MMQQLIHSLIAGASLWMGTVIGLIGIVLAIVFYQKGKEKKEFSFCLRSRQIIRKKKAKFVKLAVTYGDRKIDNLCVSRFTIWNSGNRPINATDMVSSKEITITATEESKILDVDIIGCTEDTNHFSTQSAGDHAVKVLFEYVDKFEGVVMQVIHTGTNESLKIDCKIIGGKPMKNYINDKMQQSIGGWLSRHCSDNGLSVTTYGVMILFFLLAIIATLKVFDIDILRKLLQRNDETQQSPSECLKKSFEIIMSITLWLNFLLLWFFDFSEIKKNFSIGMPRSLKQYSGFDD